MNTRRNIKGMLIVFCGMFVVLCVYLVYTVNAYGTRWFSSPYNTRLNAQKNRVIAGDILDRNGKQLATTNSAGDRVYVDDSTMRRATAHVVGDNYGQTFGAENFYSKYLLGFDQTIFERAGQAISGQQYGSDVKLTIDAALCDAAYHAMGDLNGALVLMNYKTGEILASVSKPTFDPKYVAEYISGKRTLEDSAMFNRVASGAYTPGSVYKIVTTVAALRYLPGVTERTFTCEGPLAFDATSGAYREEVVITAAEDLENKKTSEPGMSGTYSVLRDYNGEYHGTLDLKKAFAKSCNHTFAQLAMEIGADKMARVAKDLGVGDDFLFSDMVAAKSSYEKADNQRDLAWSGVGQYKNQMTPLYMCMLTAGIANDGVMLEPRLLYEVRTAAGLATYTTSAKVYRSPLSQAEVQFLQEAMLGVVQNGTGRNASISGVQVAGKTGTAEVAAGEKANAWFVGYVQENAHPLSICVVLEKGGSGGSNAAPVARQLIKKAIDLGY